MAAVSAFFDWLTTQDSAALGALVTAGIGGFVAFVVAAVNAIAARLLERAKAHRQFRAKRIAPVQKLANTLVQAAHIALKTPALAGQASQPMPPEMARLVAESETFFVPTGFPRERIDYFTKLGTEFAEHVGQYRGTQNPSLIESKLLEAHVRVIELAGSDLLLRCEAFVFGGLFLRLRSLHRHYRTTVRAVDNYTKLAVRN